MRRKLPWLAVILAVITVMATAASAYVIYACIYKDESLPFLPNWESNEDGNANSVNMSMACEYNGYSYYSDCSSAIYYIDGYTDELFYDGKFSDLCAFGEELVCVEHTEDSTKLVSISFDSKDKEILYQARSDIDEITVWYTNGSLLYFTVGDKLYTLDLDGNTEYTDIMNVKAVTKKGIYVTESGIGEGLSLADFEGNIKEQYSALNGYTVFFQFDYGKRIYVSLDDSNTIAVYDKGKDTVEHIDIPRFGRLTGVNYCDGKLYFLYMQDGVCRICNTDMNGKDYSYYSLVGEFSASYATLSVAGDKLFVAFPYSGVATKTVNLD